MDVTVGFSFGSLIDPITGNHSQLLSQLYSMVGVLVFIAIDGDHWMIEGLARSYQLVPIQSFPSLNSLVAGADRRSSRSSARRSSSPRR